MAYVKSFRNVKVVDEPTYFLLASSGIAKVCSVSSSVVYEAKYFGKETEYYFRPAVLIGDSHENYASIYQEFMFGHFWSDVLAGLLPVQPVQRMSFLDGRDKIRDMLSFYWGYRNIDKLESLKQTVSEVVKKQ